MIKERKKYELFGKPLIEKILIIPIKAQYWRCFFTWFKFVPPFSYHPMPFA